MMQEIKIKKLTIQIGKKEIELSPEEAQSLRKALDDLLGKESNTIINYPNIQYVPYYPRPYYTPYWYATGSGGHYSLTLGSVGSSAAGPTNLELK